MSRILVSIGNNVSSGDNIDIHIHRVYNAIDNRIVNVYIRHI